MDKLRNTVVLLGVAGIAAAAAPVPAPSSPDLCFTAGSVTYQLSPTRRFPTTASRSTTRRPHPDLRVRLVDRVEAADFALTDDAGAMAGSACKAAGPVKTIRIVPAGHASDLTIAVSSHSQWSDERPISRSTSIPRASATSMPPRCSRWSGSRRMATASSTAPTTSLRSAKI